MHTHDILSYGFKCCIDSRGFWWNATVSPRSPQNPLFASRVVCIQNDKPATAMRKSILLHRYACCCCWPLYTHKVYIHTLPATPCLICSRSFFAKPFQQHTIVTYDFHTFSHDPICILISTPYSKGLKSYIMKGAKICTVVFFIFLFLYHETYQCFILIVRPLFL